MAHRDERRFVGQVLQVRTAHAGSPAGDGVEVQVGPDPLVPEVHLEDGLPLLLGGQRHDDLAVEAAGPQQRRVEDVRAVGGRQDDDALVGLEAVHLGQELVQRLFALVVTTPQAGAPLTADGVDLVHEDDGGLVLSSRGEQVAHPGRADADEHLHELRSGDRDERHARLARDGPSEQGLSRARRADQEHALRDAGADRLEAGRVLEELDDLPDLLLDGVVAGDVPKRRRGALGDVHLGLALGPPAKARRLTAHASCHPHPHEHDQRQGEEPDQERSKGVGGGGDVGPGDVVFLEQGQVARRQAPRRPLGGEALVVRERPVDGPARLVDLDALDLVVPHVREECGVGHRLGLGLGGRELRQSHHDPDHGQPEDQPQDRHAARALLLGAGILLARRPLVPLVGGERRHKPIVPASTEDETGPFVPTGSTGPSPLCDRGTSTSP